MTHAETVLYASLIDVEALDELARAGLDPECIPTEGMRPVVDWALTYFHNSGRLKAPSLEMLKADWADRLEQCGVPLPDESEQVDDVSWAIDDLRSQYVLSESQRLQREIAMDIASADVADRVAAVARGAESWFGLALTVRDRRNESEGYQGIQDSLARYKERAAAPATFTGMCLGIDAIDQHILGIQDGEIAAWAAGPKGGKAATLKTPVLTPTGWTAMGDIKPGDLVIGSDGRPTLVTEIHPQGVVPIYKIEVSDGSSTLCSGEHLWLVQSHKDRQKGRPGTVLTTLQIKAMLEAGETRKTYLPMVEPVQFEQAAPLPLDPYGLGLLLGDGTFRGKSPQFSKPDHELTQFLREAFPQASIHVYDEERGQTLISGTDGLRNPVMDTLRAMDLWGRYSHEKFIPAEYLLATVSDRLALIQGLMDTDGTVDTNDIGNTGATFSTSSIQLADGLQELVESLGGTCRRRTKKAPKYQGGTGLPAHVLRITLPPQFNPFRLSRKADAWLAGRTNTNRVPVRRIAKIEYVSEEEAQCITVAAENALYVTERYLVTHNSWSLTWAAISNWRRGLETVLCTLENTVKMTEDRIACQICAVDYRAYQKGQASPAEIERIEDWLANEGADMKDGLHILSPEPGRRTASALVRQAQSLGAKGLIIDQLSHVEHPAPARKSGPEKVRDIMMGFTSLITTGRQQMPLLIAHQFNREGVKHAKAHGTIEPEHLAEGSEVERSSSHVFGLLRSETEERVGRATAHLIACRRMDRKEWSLAFEPWYGIQQAREEIGR